MVWFKADVRGVYLYQLYFFFYFQLSDVFFAIDLIWYKKRDLTPINHSTANTYQKLLGKSNLFQYGFFNSSF